MSSKWTRAVVLGLGAMMLLIGGFVIGTTVMQSNANTNRTVAFSTISAMSQQSPVLQAAELQTEMEQIFADVYNRASPSVVAISVTFDSEENQFEGGSGSGFVIDMEGHIVTNSHVVDGAEYIEINFVDGYRAEAEIVGIDPDSDLAVLQVDVPEQHLRPVVLGDSASLVIGQMTLAIGSPFGQRWTMTSGIISALDRTISGLREGYSVGAVIQTDAAINPGNSGGPLFNLQGEVIGVNSQIINDSFGIGFAIPSNLVRRVAADLIIQGRVEYSYLGIQGGEPTLQLLNDYDLPPDLNGVVVASVQNDSPAERAGLVGSTNSELEIITAINGEPLRSFSELIAYLASETRPGDVITLTVLRGDELFNVELQLGVRLAQ